MEFKNGGCVLGASPVCAEGTILNKVENSWSRMDAAHIVLGRLFGIRVLLVGPILSATYY